MTKAWSNTNQSGFSVVEILLAVVTFGLIVSGVVGALAYGRLATAGSGDRARAAALAEEGIEAVRNIRDAGYTNLTDGTYGLAQTANQWALSGTSDTNGIYTRQVVIAAGNPPSSKNITVNVTWTTGKVSRQTQVATHLTNWRASWPNATMSGVLDTSQNALSQVATEGNYAYAITSAGTPNFYATNISNPASPTQVGSLVVANPATDIVVSGNYAYLTTGRDASEIQIINISNPAAPTIAASYDAAGNGDAQSLQKIGNYLYFCRSQNGGQNEFQIVDVSNPTAPILVGAYGNNQNNTDVYVNGSYAYLINESDTQEVMALNISNPATPTLAGALDLTGKNNPTAAAGFGNRLFVGQAADLRAVNLATPTAPALMSSLTMANTITDIATKPDNTIFLAVNERNTSFQVINVTNLSSMSSVRTVTIGGNPVIGLAYNPTYNIVVGTSTLNTQNIVIFKPN